MEEKKTYLSLYLPPEIKAHLKRQADLEGRSVSNLCDRLLSWAARWLKEAGDSQVLSTWEAGPAATRPSKRVSEELQAQLHSALGVIFERAPSTVVDRVAEYLTQRAGKFGGDD